MPCVADQFAADAESSTVDVDKIPEEWMGLDVGAKTIAAYSAALEECKTIVSFDRGSFLIMPCCAATICCHA